MEQPHTFTIGPDHPSRPGHFPGHPLVPGVVLLEAAIAPLLRAHPHRVTRLDDAKFLAPVRFGDPVAVVFTPAGPDRIAITAQVAGQIVLRCRIRLGPPA